MMMKYSCKKKGLAVIKIVSVLIFMFNMLQDPKIVCKSWIPSWFGAIPSSQEGITCYSEVRQSFQQVTPF